MNADTPLAGLPLDTALQQMLLTKRKEIDNGCHRFINIGDPESLHDLRVAMRRMISMLIGFAPCFQQSNGVTEPLHTLFGKTNHARDLEVTLALLDRHHLRLTWLQRQWQDELDDEYRILRENVPPLWWPLSHRFDTPENLIAGAPTALTLGKFAAGQMKKEEKRLLQQIRRLCNEWDDKHAHKLRIHGKRLRYLLEPFADGQTEAAKAVKRLKNFQDRLGDYHDLIVLRKRLRRLRQSNKSVHDKALVEAVRHLKRELERERRGIRQDYSGKRRSKLADALGAAHEVLARQ